MPLLFTGDMGFPAEKMPGTESTRLQGLRPSVLADALPSQVFRPKDGWRRNRPLAGYFQCPARIGGFQPPAPGPAAKRLNDPERRAIRKEIDPPVQNHYPRKDRQLQGHIREARGGLPCGSLLGESGTKPIPFLR